MNYFEKYSSNTVGAGANQCFFEPSGDSECALSFFKITKGGEYGYSLLFSDVIDSTYADGKRSYVNLTLGSWHINSLKVGRCKSFPAISPDKVNVEEVVIEDFVSLTFSGKESVDVPSGGVCSSDEKKLTFEKGDYMAVEICYSGKRIPSHPESMLPVYKKDAEGYKYCTDAPLPLMIGCDRAVKERIGYLGDSITQGIGAGYNTYKHWCAYLADMIGDEYSHYNLGIGYARAKDAAEDGGWLERAKTCDTVYLCLGTNDVAHDAGGARAIAGYLDSIICKLKSANCRIILQTAPPFDRVGERKERWFELNDIIKSELSSKVDLLFDNVPCLRYSEEFPEKSRYGGHPNAEGCLVWAKALYEETKHLFKGEEK